MSSKLIRVIVLKITRAGERKRGEQKEERETGGRKGKGQEN